MDKCYCVSILKSDDEFWRDLGEDNPGKSEKEVTDVPQGFKDWVRDNRERIEKAEKRGTQPYFIRDNNEYIQGILKPAEHESAVSSSNSLQETHSPKYGYGAAMKLGRSATKEAMNFIESIDAPIVSEEQKENIIQLSKIFGIKVKDIRPMSFIDADEGKSNAFKDIANCQSCVVSFFARRHGLNCYAMPYKGERSSASYRLGERFQDAWINPKTGKIVEPMKLKGASDNEIIAKLKKQLSADGEYVLGINQTNERGHVVNIIKKGAQIIVHDEQAVRASERFIKLESLSEIESLELLRVDKLILNIDIVKQVLGVF